ncbi:hypothetical protein H3H54_16275 [Brachybacterium sp. Z12]|uniref:hypothetical protein n=1 Tax=Brachybacterium sp. Z12 TaxID=2759167 RepID=UPI00185FD9C4|nr:hypothetical protein [Brachybacterium sp. Z12]QNN82487.1 hypothetical protein H3H54_16275 [Brachybacterium sp. Z12]
MDHMLLRPRGIVVHDGGEIREHPAVAVALLVHVHPRLVPGLVGARVVGAVLAILIEDPLLDLRIREELSVPRGRVLERAIDDTTTLLVILVRRRIGLRFREGPVNLVPQCRVRAPQQIGPGLDVVPVVPGGEPSAVAAILTQRIGEAGEVFGRAAVQEIIELRRGEPLQLLREIGSGVAVVPPDLPPVAVSVRLGEQVCEFLVLLVAEYFGDVIVVLDRGSASSAGRGTGALPSPAPSSPAPSPPPGVLA